MSTSNPPDIARRRWLAATGIGLAAAGARAGQAPFDNTLRVVFNTTETTFDPPQIPDENSSHVAACIFEAPLTYDYLARPTALRPQTAVALPEVSSDFRRYTFRIRPGIFFADDPAFKGRPRELIAEDYVYSVKRYYDPAINSEHLYVFENAKLLGLSELRHEALAAKRRFDYDRAVEGIRALDRYTFVVQLGNPSPRFAYWFAQPALTGAMAREVVEAYGDDIGAHPVGTGPFRLAFWRRGSRIELARRPEYRLQHFAAAPAEGDAQGRAIADELAGRRLPLVDRIEVNVIEEAQPRWLAFLNGQVDQIELPFEFAPIAMPHDRLAPNLARRGIRAQRSLQPDMLMNYFNMTHPVVGGYAPEKVALRRAIGLAFHGDAEISGVRRGQAIVAESVVAPHASGYDAGYRSEMGQYSPARAKALLDLYGYVDRDGDGWRELPDGRPLELRLSTISSQRDRAVSEVWRKSMAEVGLKIRFDVATWADLLKRSRTASLMMWGYAWVATSPDGAFFLGIGYGPNAGESNDARFSLPAYDRLYERQDVLPDGPERDAVMRDAKNLLAAYMPYKAHAHTILTDLLQPRVRGYVRHPFMRDNWCYVGVDREWS
ncbi:MAG: bicyclomycin resistance protein [Proteobacteria bacterium]|nr:bicyclomycin resistance protein [Pseudomonadota bacterium]